MSAHIREEADGDWGAIRAVHRLAFAGPAEALLVDKLRATGAASIALIAERDAQIIGHILFSVLEAPMRALSLAPVGVHPRFQGLGIGSALIRRGLEVAAARSWEAVFVLGDPSYYQRFGFSVEAARQFSCLYAGEHFMVRALAGREIPSKGELVFAAPFGEME